MKENEIRTRHVTLLATAAAPLVTALLPAGSLAAGKTSLVSRQSAIGGLGADGESGSPSVSANGRFVAFSTAAQNLGGPLDGGAVLNVYDRRERRAELVSRQSASVGGQAGDANSSSAAVSADGRVLAFNTFASNLGGPLAAPQNVYAQTR